MFHVKQFDVIVIGGGHAGTEAALAASRMGVKTALITMDASKIGEMSCNPSVGGVGKGQLVKEIDALGGEMGRNADHTGIMFKRLNTRKGSAVQSSRCQSDKRQYAVRMQSVVRSQGNLEIIEAEVKALVVENGQVVGLSTASAELKSSHIIITAGTFMCGLMHVGFETSDGGRFGERPSIGLSQSLIDLGFSVARLKTGTPARLLAGSLDFSKMETQLGDDPPQRFSFWPSTLDLLQVPCYLGFTNEATHSVIRNNLSRSPLYSGKIQGVGPRYCPSIEDKVVKFPDKPRHQLFFEPEALDSDWIYPNGISTSLPADVQEAFIRTVKGCEEAVLVRPGYAVEYDFVDPKQLKPTLETNAIVGLYLAGQVNGTSGYEEAGAQGLIAGINAALSVQGKPAFVPDRTESYIGVMIDDLTTLGVNEPYRMFTSRAEFRLSVREDNADFRLSRKGYQMGLLTRANYELFLEKERLYKETRQYLKTKFIKPADCASLSYPQSMESILKRPEFSLKQVLSLDENVPRETFDPKLAETLEVEVKYEGYIALQQEEIQRLNRMKETTIPDSLDYQEVEGLSFEVRDKLKKNRPRRLSDASRISGITPAALTALLFHIRKKGSTGDSPSL